MPLPNNISNIITNYANVSRGRLLDILSEGDIRTVLTYGSLEQVKALGIHPILKTYRFSNDETPLSTIIESGRLDLVRYFVEEQGIDVTSSDIYGCFPLHDARRNGHIELAQYIEGICAQPARTSNYANGYGFLQTAPLTAFTFDLVDSDAYASESAVAHIDCIGSASITFD